MTVCVSKTPVANQSAYYATQLITIVKGFLTLAYEIFLLFNLILFLQKLHWQKDKIVKIALAKDKIAFSAEISPLTLGVLYSKTFYGRN